MRRRGTSLTQPEMQEAVIDAFRKAGSAILTGQIVAETPEGSLILGLNPRQRVMKRAMDLVGSTVLLVCLSPALALVTSLIKLTSPGPVFFRQSRPGYLGEHFRMLKFRTMTIDAEERLKEDPELHGVYLENDCKLPAEIDPRFTRIGRLLRKTSLDELPQLLNVLTGEMSLVGPRPVLPEQINEYGECLAGYYAMRPGITGVWQTNGRSTVSFPLRAYLDLENLRDWSPRKDMAILLRTIPSVLAGTGAH